MHNLRAWVELLTSPRFRGRHAGENGARGVATLLAAQMTRSGLAPARSGDGYCQGFPFLDGQDWNVVGHLPATPADGRPVMLVGAHYDGQGVHPAGMSDPGADDNASGVAALLEVARLTGSRPDASRIAWIFVAFGAEEAGRQGAHAYMRRSAEELANVELAVNLDMVGRPLPGGRGDAIGYLALGASRSRTLAYLRAAADDSGLEIRTLEEAGELRPTISDAEVLARRLPTLLLSTALHQDHHRPSDTPEKIDYAQIERAARLVLDLGDILAAP